MDGILNINKPQGKTSFSIVSMVKRLSRERRVGHAGTLDPMATGVLPICLGKGTRVTEFLMNTTKVYRAEIELGITTDTYDASGTITNKADPSGISQGQLELALTSFHGSIQQTPPMYSAVKYHGKRLYELARAGKSVDRKSRLVKIYNLELTDWQPPIATIEVACGRGTYIRSLAYDLGQTLGCGANLRNLTRLKCGLFDIRDAVSVPQLEKAFCCGHWQHLLYPIDSVLSHWNAMVVSNDTGRVIKNGRPLVLDDSSKEPGYIEQPSSAWSSSENRCRVYTSDGCFLGLLRLNPKKGQWQPEKIFL